jgi:hypothetical protein
MRQTFHARRGECPAASSDAYELEVPKIRREILSYALCFAGYFASGVRSALRINEERKNRPALGRHSLARHGNPRKKAALCASQSDGRHNVATTISKWCLEAPLIRTQPHQGRPDRAHFLTGRIGVLRPTAAQLAPAGPSALRCGMQRGRKKLGCDAT